ncbi:E3 ubiquitin-protein ligase SINA-like [Actinidia chinensis var. chinensis]|uniref:RING-type E3 ubiquitin transferase n=1 Tax=Actinidia chinensis var. chinensis TaxID=1590841 RepID=A0A2R6RKR1_ACTCC|nr:E3 ubiquitin-protein ligase SINA-like [Actinidia chinensis var. chinensis]
MAKFSVGREDDSEGPSSPRPKKQRTTTNQQQQQQQQQQVVEDEEEVVESEHGAEEEERESEYDEEEESEEEEDDEEDDQNETETIAGPSWSKDDRDGSISVTLTDPDVLDCPICLEPLSSPVFQCENGHVACSSCCIKLRNKCPSCSWPIGYNRCRAIEKVIESVKISCENLKYGCKETVIYSKKHGHEKACTFAPCSCPLSACTFLGSSNQLSLHFSSTHPNSGKHFRYNCLFPINLEMRQKCLILKEQSEGKIFVLNNAFEIMGNAVNISCIGPSSSKSSFSYDLIARVGGSSLKLQSFTKNVPRWVEHTPAERFLLVPNNFFGSCGQLKLELCIWRPR